MAEMPDLAGAARKAAEAVRGFTEAARPKTEAEYWEWLRYNDPIRYVAERRAARGARSPVLGLLHTGTIPNRQEAP